jgi:hypothetical protein
MMEINHKRRRSSLVTALRIFMSAGLFAFVVLCLAMLLAGDAQRVGADAGSQTNQAGGGSGCWSKIVSPDPGSYSVLKDVEVVSDNSIWAVGSYSIDHEGFALTMKWDGTN